jgi:hypothetical protein
MAPCTVPEAGKEVQSQDVLWLARGDRALDMVGRSDHPHEFGVRRGRY